MLMLNSAFIRIDVPTTNIQQRSVIRFYVIMRYEKVFLYRMITCYEMELLRRSLFSMLACGKRAMFCLEIWLENLRRKMKNKSNPK